MRDGHSSWTPVARRLQQPTRTAGSGHRSRSLLRLRAKPRAVPIRSCSRWGLPCRRRCRRRGALLPHRFTLAAVLRNAPRRFVLCGTFPRLAPAGRYPAPLVHGARTFLPGNLSALPERPSGRLTRQGWGRGRRRQEAARCAKSRARAAMLRTRPRWASRSRKVARVDSSADAVDALRPEMALERRHRRRGWRNRSCR